MANLDAAAAKMMANLREKTGATLEQWLSLVKKKAFAKHGEIVKFLKKEYKAITGNSLTLTKEGDSTILVQRISNYRTDVQAHCDYRIGGLTDVVDVNGGTDEERVRFGLRLCLCAEPTERQVATLVGLHASELAHFAAKAAEALSASTDPLGPLPDGMDPAEAAAWTMVASALLNMDPFLVRS